MCGTFWKQKQVYNLFKRETLVCVWRVIVLQPSYSATTFLSFWLHSSGQLSVFSFLQNGIIWHLFLVWPADCRSSPLLLNRTRRHCPCLLPSIFSSEINYSILGSYNNSNQIKVDLCGQPFFCALIWFRLCYCCNAVCAKAFSTCEYPW